MCLVEGTASVLFSSAFFNCWKWLKAKPHYHTYEHQGVHAFVSHKDYYFRHFSTVSLSSPYSLSHPLLFPACFPTPCFLFKGIVWQFRKYVQFPLYYSTLIFMLMRWVKSWTNPTGTDLAVNLVVWPHLELQLKWCPETPKDFSFYKKHMGLEWLTSPLRSIIELYQYIFVASLMCVQSQEEVCWFGWSVAFTGTIGDHLWTQDPGLLISWSQGMLSLA